MQRPYIATRATLFVLKLLQLQHAAPLSKSCQQDRHAVPGSERKRPSIPLLQCTQRASCDKPFSCALKKTRVAHQEKSTHSTTPTRSRTFSSNFIQLVPEPDGLADDRAEPLTGALAAQQLLGPQQSLLNFLHAPCRGRRACTASRPWAVAAVGAAPTPPP